MTIKTVRTVRTADLFRGLWVVTTFAATSLSVFSCGEDPVREPVLRLDFSSREVGAAKDSQFITIEASGSWNLYFEEGDVDWCHLSVSSGVGTPKTRPYMSWDENGGDNPQPRSCTVVLDDGNTTVSLSFTQNNPSPVLATEIIRSPRRDWLELPADNDESFYFISHDMKVAGTNCRNYSLLWDKDALVAHWVAYPLNASLIGNGGNTKAWGKLDPNVPEIYQPVLADYFTGGYQRGHQCPSADRYAANESTYYGTNMTPQLGSLNAEAWAGLEAYVRTWAGNSPDTLFVVTGCTVKGSTRYSCDNNGKKVTVPSGYYKALLHYSDRKVHGTSTEGYSGIAFYFDHSAASKNLQTIRGHSMSIDELETRTGEDFFVNPASKGRRGCRP